MKKLDWSDTVAEIYRRIPEARNPDWSAVFRQDPKVLGDVINDIIKVSISEKGRPGKRSASSYEDVQRDFALLTGSDHSSLPFTEALAAAMGAKMSLRALSSRSGLDKMVVRRLLLGEGTPPTMQHMELLAKGLGKDPGYFLEYRAAFICNNLYKVMVENPDASVAHYSKMKG